MKLSEQTILAFADRVASTEPAPGGGSCAALCGSLGAALTAMVGGMTLGREKYAEFAANTENVRIRCDELKAQLADVMDRDTEAFHLVSAAYGMPKSTDEEKAARSAAIQEGLKACTETPMEMMTLAFEALTLASSMIGRFNENCASDLGVAVLTLKACIQGAWLNVLINIGSIKDQAYAEEKRSHCEAIPADALTGAVASYEELEKLIGG